MKIQKSGFTPLQKIDNKAVKKEAPSVKDGVVLGNAGQDPDFLKLGDIGSQTASGSKFENLKVDAVPYIISGAVIAGSLTGLAGVPLKYTAYAIGAGGFLAGLLKSGDATTVGKVVGAGAIIGGGLGAFNSSPVGPIVGGLIGGTIGAIAGAIAQYGG